MRAKNGWTATGGKLGINGRLTGQVYAHMVPAHDFPTKQQLQGNRPVQQDDPAKIHQDAEALKPCEAFSARTSLACQAHTMADVWPIENVWAIVEQRAKKKCTASKAGLRKVITNIWQESGQDKD